MKIATAGKGGSGKTTVAGTLARILAEDHRKVLAIDGDPNPNLALMLGIDRDAAARIPSIPPSVMETAQLADGTQGLRMTLSGDEVLSRFGARAPDDIDLIVMGKPADGTAGSGCMCASHRAVRGLISEMADHGEYTVTDLEAGLEHLKRGTARKVDVMLVIAEPYYRSLEAAARTHSLAKELGVPHVYVVANKVKNASDEAAIDEFCARHSMPIIGRIGYEPSFVDAEREARAPLDFAPHSAGIRSIRGIASAIHALETVPA